MTFADSVYKTFVSVLGGTTAIAGVWLIGTMVSGFTRDRKVSLKFCTCDHCRDQIPKVKITRSYRKHTNSSSYMQAAPVNERSQNTTDTPSQ